MALIQKTELIVNQRFDQKTCRHFLNEKVVVLHCHHFASLYTQLADDCGMLDGRQLLAEVAEDNFYEIFKSYFCEHSLQKNTVWDFTSSADSPRLMQTWQKKFDP